MRDWSAHCSSQAPIPNEEPFMSIGLSAFVLATLMQSNCDSAPCASLSPPPPTLRTRLSVGVGTALGSAEEDILDLERYGGVHMVFALDATWLTSARVGVGAWGAWSLRTSRPSDGSRRLTENDWLIGLQAPIVLADSSVLWLLTPRVGYGAALLSFGSGGTFLSGFAWGGEISVVARDDIFGVSLGGYSARTPPPGAGGGVYDMGTVYIAITGRFDG
jgi:hypothetical protein